MPNTLFALDAGFPRFTGQEGQEQRLGMVMDYLVQLQEQLRYILTNLGAENFNETELERIGNTFLEPVVQSVKDAQNHLSTLEQKADSFTLKVENGKASSFIRLMAGETEVCSEEIRFSGVVTFTDEGDGISRINGGSVYSETIYGDMLMVMPEDRTGGEGVRIKNGGVYFWVGSRKAQLDTAALSRNDSGGLTMETFELGDILLSSVGDLELKAVGDIRLAGNVYVNGRLLET